MNIDFIYIIILLPCLISIALFVYLISSDKTEKNVNSGNIEKNNPKKITTFENDSQYLMFLVDYFCKSAYTNKLLPYQKNNNNYTIISDDIFNEVVIETTRQISKYLSNPYRETISYYVPNVTEFASELVYNTVSKMVLELNKETINNLSKRR
jgi:hypothetical protein